MNAASVFLIAAAIACGVRLEAAKALLDISGDYVESGMTIRASSGAPGTNVSLCALLSMDLSQATHKLLADLGRTAHVVQHDDSLLEFVISKDGVGSCEAAWTKADGLKVDADVVMIMRKPLRGWRAIYRLQIDRERRLIVSAEFIADARGRTESAVYAFSRVTLPSDVEQKRSDKRPNKSPEPTSCAVMPRAGEMKMEMQNWNLGSTAARVMPAQAVAHL